MQKSGDAVRLSAAPIFILSTESYRIQKFKRLKKTASIVPRAFVKEINIARKTRVSMENNGLAAHNEITDFESTQQSNELDDVSRKPGRA